MFKNLREKLEAMMAAATPAEHPRETAGLLREALIEMRAAVQPLREGLEESERTLVAARAELETAVRRRDMAAQIPDEETVTIADKYIARHQGRLVVLEQKVAAQRAELMLAEQDLAQMTTEFNAAVKGLGGATAGQSAGAAWDGLGRAGMDRPEVDTDQELLRHRLDRAAIEADADAKLEELKRRMGRQ